MSRILIIMLSFLVISCQAFESKFDKTAKDICVEKFLELDHRNNTLKSYAPTLGRRRPFKITWENTNYDKEIMKFKLKANEVNRDLIEPEQENLFFELQKNPDLREFVISSAPAFMKECTTYLQKFREKCPKEVGRWCFNSGEGNISKAAYNYLIYNAAGEKPADFTKFNDIEKWAKIFDQMQ